MAPSTGFSRKHITTMRMMVVTSSITLILFPSVFRLSASGAVIFFCFVKAGGGRPRQVGCGEYAPGQEEDFPNPRNRPRTCRLGIRTYFCRKGYDQSPASTERTFPGQKKKRRWRTALSKPFTDVLRFQLSPAGRRLTRRSAPWYVPGAAQKSKRERRTLLPDRHLKRSV